VQLFEEVARGSAAWAGKDKQHAQQHARARVRARAPRQAACPAMPGNFFSSEKMRPCIGYQMDMFTAAYFYRPGHDAEAHMRGCYTN
jgi:hypothetical protein